MFDPQFTNQVSIGDTTIYDASILYYGERVFGFKYFVSKGSASGSVTFPSKFHVCKREWFLIVQDIKALHRGSYEPALPNKRPVVEKIPVKLRPHQSFCA